jgi:hypothetical protein
MLHFTGLMVGPVSLTTMPVPFRRKRARHERHLFQPKIGVLPPAVRRRSFRSGSVPASLRLRSTYPFTEPQAEACI